MFRGVKWFVYTNVGAYLNVTDFPLMLTLHLSFGHSPEGAVQLNQRAFHLKEKKNII